MDDHHMDDYHMDDHHTRNGITHLDVLRCSRSIIKKIIIFVVIEMVITHNWFVLSHGKVKRS